MWVVSPMCTRIYITYNFLIYLPHNKYFSNFLRGTHKLPFRKNELFRMAFQQRNAQLSHDAYLDQ